MRSSNVVSLPINELVLENAAGFILVLSGLHRADFTRVAARLSVRRRPAPALLANSDIFRAAYHLSAILLYT
jgi:hypothetical protein